MFEDSLVESRVAHLSPTTRWTMAGSTALQLAAAAALIVLPLLHPERLTFHASTPLVFTPPPPRPPIPQTRPEPAASQGPSIADLPSAARPITTILITHPGPAVEEPPVIGTIIGMGRATGFPDALRNGVGSDTNVTVAAARPVRPIPVSEGVSTGMLLSPIRPVYPAIAKAARISGTVVVEAIISKTGTIESLHVVSGPEMLRGAALDAIRAARYQPFRLNGEPTEVQTTITVNFRLGA
ncbi:energy transducer TonB [Edaphobacter aggregans]|uniref:energy transducer TonB n=1 Tax=Edaphobacter aggregans TaxID=570835 RepID=UPI000556A397|nr:energy transducer TonB [Edaphobacter aggregans]